MRKAATPAAGRKNKRNADHHSASGKVKDYRVENVAFYIHVCCELHSLEQLLKQRSSPRPVPATSGNESDEEPLKF